MVLIYPYFDSFLLVFNPFDELYFDQNLLHKFSENLSISYSESTKFFRSIDCKNRVNLCDLNNSNFHVYFNVFVHSLSDKFCFSNADEPAVVGLVKYIVIFD